MSLRRGVRIRLATSSLLVLALAGCASLSGWETEHASVEIPAETRVLAEVIMIASRSDALSGKGLFRNWPQKAAAAGYADAEIVDGGTATLWSYCYGHNSGVPLCAHHGHYVAYVPAEFRNRLTANDAATAGDLVEAELKRMPDGSVVGKVVAVYRPGADWSPCRNVRLQRDASIITALSVGPPQANWIECDETVKHEWVRRPVQGAPLTGGAPVSQWFKRVRST